MKDESQLEEMRAALRGDRERAERARRRSLEYVPAPVERLPAEPEPAPRRQATGLRGLFRRR